MENIFENPEKYINALEKIQLINIERGNEFAGKSILVISLTKYCNAGCKFCIFKSPMKRGNVNLKKDEFDIIGIEKSIEFINKSNIGYLLISGGGEPFLKEDLVLKLVSEVKVKNIVIVSNGFWANNLERAIKILDKLYNIKERTEKKITLRISVDKWHEEHLGESYIKNLINIFSSKYCYDNELKFKVHSIIEDKTIFDILKNTGYDYIVKHSEKYTSDNDRLNKFNKRRIVLKLFNGYEFEVEFAKLFKSNLEVDLKDNIKRQINVFEEDLTKNQIGSFSTVINTDGSKGLDILINYNGNVSTWANYQTFNSANLYIDNYEEIMSKIFTDLISYSFLRESLNDIIKIIKEINPIAVKRAIGINIRDYFGMYLLYEKKTLLYYYIIILKKYISESIITNFELIPKEIKNIINLDFRKIVELYNKSDYSIINQYLKTDFCKEEWEDLFFLINKGHFKVTNTQVDKALDYFNKKTGQHYRTYQDVINFIDVNRYKRLLKRFNL